MRSSPLGGFVTTLVECLACCNDAHTLLQAQIQMSCSRSSTGNVVSSAAAHRHCEITHLDGLIYIYCCRVLRLALRTMQTTGLPETYDANGDPRAPHAESSVFFDQMSDSEVAPSMKLGCRARSACRRSWRRCDPGDRGSNPFPPANGSFRGFVLCFVCVGMTLHKCDN
ncbi:uncharacterized protein B0H64DRAFT_403847 [Chaetomium fimeti]|uniref:Uncharacterized protein n=1 Tax=Chaetomium fimeti TaxID=1854472 RepID=A0AAE0HB44_9PEZI|nr:hypothetical protein B0H64DRAFT_403847 [Chaetomium fimeti]